MVVTRPSVPDAGSARRRAAARVALLGASLLLAACATGDAPRAAPGERALLLPLYSLTGAWLAPEGGAPRTFQQVLVPTAVALNGPDLFYVDAALGALLRYDSHRQRLTRIAPLRAWAGVRLHALPDSSLYVLDPRASSLIRIARDGRVLQRVADPRVLGGVAEFAVFEPSGQLLLADRGANRLRVLSSSFTAPIEMPLRRTEQLRLDAIWAVAAGKDAWYVLDRSRRQVVRVDPSGGLLQAFGEDVLRLPSAIGVDRYGRVFVVDEGAQAIQVFMHGRYLRSIPAASFNVARILAMQVSDVNLVVAGDGASGIRVFQLAPPREGRS